MIVDNEKSWSEWPDTQQNLEDNFTLSEVSTCDFMSVVIQVKVRAYY